MNIANVAQNLRDVIQRDGHLDLKTRRVKLENLRRSIVKHEKEIVAALKGDLRRSAFETYATEIGFILEEIAHTLKHMDDWAKVKKVKTPIAFFPGCSSIHPEPYGVVLLISPWNYPFQLCVSPFIGAIAAGNRVVVKPSEMAPQTSEVIKKIFTDVFNENEVVVIEGGVEETQVLLKQKFDYIFFTGSTPVGKIIMKAAAEHLTPVTLELGGKSPCLIEESANIEVAARRIAWGKFMNAGQTCVAPDYVLVPKRLQEEFISKFKEVLNSFYGSNPEGSVDYSRIINHRHFDRLSALLIKEKIAYGGEVKREEKYIGPTLMKDVSWSDKVMEDEIFGPILPILTYDKWEDAIQSILDYPKPLALYLFTESQAKQDEVMDRIPFGGGCVNDTMVHLANPNLPFGGVGSSGIGSYHGQRSFDTFTHYKSLYKQGTKVDIPLRYPPYNESRLSVVKLLMG